MKTTTQTTQTTVQSFTLNFNEFKTLKNMLKEDVMIINKYFVNNVNLNVFLNDKQIKSDYKSYYNSLKVDISDYNNYKQQNRQIDYNNNNVIRVAVYYLLNSVFMFNLNESDNTTKLAKKCNKQLKYIKLDTDIISYNFINNITQRDIKIDELKNLLEIA